jgi:hypothetical protein
MRKTTKKAHNAGTAIWVTKEGKMLRLSEMEDKHLLNSIRMLERRAAETAATLTATFGATVATEKILAQTGIYKQMQAELEFRLKKAEGGSPKMFIDGERVFDFSDQQTTTKEKEQT